MKHERPIQFDRLLQVRAPEALSEALNVAANRKIMSRSGYIRAVLIERLKADGLDPSTFAAA
jgi:hypothetical protein